MRDVAGFAGGPEGRTGAEGGQKHVIMLLIQDSDDDSVIIFSPAQMVPYENPGF